MGKEVGNCERKILACFVIVNQYSIVMKYSVLHRTVIRLISISVKVGICAVVVGLNETLV